MKAELTAIAPAGAGRRAEQMRRTAWAAGAARLELLVAARAVALAFVARAWSLAGVGIEHMRPDAARRFRVTGDTTFGLSVYRMDN
jgi:hypothetical protein